MVIRPSLLYCKILLTMDKLKIELYTCTYNEEQQLLFAIEYWKRLITDKSELKVTVFDNYSTDGTLDILRQYPWITVKSFQSNNEMDENLLTFIRNNCWKGSKADWVMMVDLDEVFYSPNIVDELIALKEKGAAVVACQWYALVGTEMPEHKAGVLLHKQIGRGFRQYINHKPGQSNYGKLQLFNPQKVVSMNYSPGMHIATPVCSDMKELPFTISYKLLQFHFNKGFGETYMVNKRKELWDRLNKIQKARGYCYEYGFPEEKTREEYRANQAKSVDISDL